MWRAIGALETDSRVRNPDFMASNFLSPMSRALLGVSPLRTWMTKHYSRKLPGAYGYATARTLHLDAIFSRALDEGAEQVVLLGAGYDSRAYRFRDRLSKVRVFELDLAATQERKKKRLTEVLGTLPGWVTYVPINFDAQKLEDVLPAAGFDPTKRTFFLWEGVSMYLTEEAIDQTLGFVANNSPAGSGIAFDFVALGALHGDSRYPGMDQWVNVLADLGHPMTFGIEEDATDAFLRKRGLELVSQMGSADMEREYLIKSDGKLLCNTSSFLCIVHARVQASAPASAPV